MSDTFTITDAINLGDFPDEMMEVLDRLQWLPEFGMSEQLATVWRLVKEAEDAEEIATKKRMAARGTAHGLLRKVCEEWTADEIEHATGYRP
jgi:hypothetical protein